VQEQADPAATLRREDSPEVSEPATHAHQEQVTGALHSSTQPTTRDGESLSGRGGSCAPSPDALETLRSQMRAGFQRRNEQFVHEIFDKYSSPDSAGLSKESLAQALRDLGVCLSADEVHEVFYTQDLNSDGWISWTEFLMVVSRPSKIEEWAATLPLAALLADCMPSMDDADPVRGISKLGLADMQAISACYNEGLIKLLRYVSQDV